MAETPSKSARERSAPSKCAFGELDAAEVDVLQDRAGEVRAGEIGALEPREGEVGAGEVRPDERAALERRRAEARAGEEDLREVEEVELAVLEDRARAPTRPPTSCWRSVARVKSVPASVARERSARVRSARFRSLPERSMPGEVGAGQVGRDVGVLDAPVVPLRRRAGASQCSGLAIARHCNRPARPGRVTIHGR